MTETKGAGVVALVFQAYRADRNCLVFLRSVASLGLAWLRRAGGRFKAKPSFSISVRAASLEETWGLRMYPHKTPHKPPPPFPCRGRIQEAEGRRLRLESGLYLASCRLQRGRRRLVLRAATGK